MLLSGDWVSVNRVRVHERALAGDGQDISGPFAAHLGDVDGVCSTMSIGFCLLIPEISRRNS